MLRMKKLAMEDENIAYALIGQAVLDEAKIGPDMIRISYSEEEARYLWEVGKRWNLINDLRTEKAHGAKRCMHGSSVRRRLKDLEKAGKVRKAGKNVKEQRKRITGLLNYGLGHASVSQSGCPVGVRGFESHPPH